MTSSLVRDVMTTEVVTAVPSTPFKEIAARLAQHRISAVPVVDADRRVLGIVTEADLLLKQGASRPRGKRPLHLGQAPSPGTGESAAAVAGKLMTAPAVTVPPTATVTEAARRMHTARVKRLPVVDETGQLLGIVSRADLLKVFTRPDEAIRSEIIRDVIDGNFMMNPSRFLIHVDDGVVVLEGKAERSSLIPYLVRARPPRGGRGPGGEPAQLRRRRPQPRHADGQSLDGSTSAPARGRWNAALTPAREPTTPRR